MSTYLIRTAPDADVYVVWSTVIDGPVYAGTRVEVYDHLLNQAVQRAKPEVLSDLQLAAEAGTSIQYVLPGESCPPGAWADDNLQYGGDRQLPRAKLHEFIELWMQDKDETAEALLENLDN